MGILHTELTINWWKTLAELPDYNTIENLWHELKEYIRREVKPKTTEELTCGIQRFWATIDAAKCIKYIQHLCKVIPKVIESFGGGGGGGGGNRVLRTQCNLENTLLLTFCILCHIEMFIKYNVHRYYTKYKIKKNTEAFSNSCNFLAVLS